MNERAQRIKRLVEDSGKSYQELSNITGVSKSSLQRYAAGVTAKIPLEVIAKLSKAFGVSQEYIMGWEQEPEELADITAQVLLDPDVLKMVEQFLQLSESDQYAVRLMVASLLEKQKKTDAGVSQEVETVSLLETE